MYDLGLSLEESMKKIVLYLMSKDDFFYDKTIELYSLTRASNVLFRWNDWCMCEALRH